MNAPVRPSSALAVTWPRPRTTLPGDQFSVTIDGRDYTVTADRDADCIDGRFVDQTTWRVTADDGGPVDPDIADEAIADARDQDWREDYADFLAGRF